MRTQVCIIGGGPAGMFLSHVLHRAGVESIVLEKHAKEYVLGRIRAGVLEHGTVSLLREHGLSDRMNRDGLPHDGTGIVWQGKNEFFIDTAKWTGKQMMVWGQTQITEDLYAARERDQGVVICEAENVTLADVPEKPTVTFEVAGEKRTIDCDFIAGCDGSHGVSRLAIPPAARKEFERKYPFAWLGVMVERPPLKDIIYAYHEAGFALASHRSPALSRYYIQVPSSDKASDWPDEKFWAALENRFPERLSKNIQIGPSIEKSIAPLRSFVSEPMRWGRLFLAGDSAHIVPPTGAKGLNLAFSDVFYLSRAFIAHYQERDDHYLDCYSQMALRRVWAAENLSWRLTTMLHVFPEEAAFDRKIRENEYDLLLKYEAKQRALAFEYVGLPFED